MSSITVKDLEAYLLDRYKDQKHTNALFMKLVEEVGEVAEALNKRDGRKYDDGFSELAQELVDVIHYTVAIAAVNGIDLETTIIEKDKRASVKYNHEQNLEQYLADKQ